MDGNIGDRMPRKIYIVGGTGSGKSFVAEELSTKLHLPWYDIDGDEVYALPLEFRIQYLQAVRQQTHWICESDGIDPEWVESADLTMVILTPRLTRVIRVLKRAALKLLGKQFKGQLGKETFRTLTFRLALTWRYEKSILNPYLKNYHHSRVFQVKHTATTLKELLRIMNPPVLTESSIPVGNAESTGPH